MRLIPLHKGSAATLTPAEFDKCEQRLIKLRDHFDKMVNPHFMASIGALAMLNQSRNLIAVSRSHSNGWLTRYINGGYDRNTLDEGYTYDLFDGLQPILFKLQGTPKYLRAFLDLMIKSNRFAGL